ncbi:hypothetical protein TNCV_2452101 [Trichonephila clavipes]|nr:hypothetical protein TNCV_2452101 [Trichonephila clavipes]
MCSTLTLDSRHCWSGSKLSNPSPSLDLPDYFYGPPEESYLCDSSLTFRRVYPQYSPEHTKLPHMCT